MKRIRLARRRIHDKSDVEKLDYLLGQTIPSDGGCRVWAGFIQRNGYVKTRIGGISEWVHRIVFILAGGALLTGQEVCHKCDIRHCIEPAHLFAGSRLDNMRDAVQKGRQANGTRLPQTKIADTSALLERARTGESYETIALDLGVSPQLVSRISRKNGIFRHKTYRMLEVRS
jgi:HNH endonuclease